MYFLHFSSQYTECIIKSIYEDNINLNGYNYNFVYNMIKEHEHIYKNKCIDKIIMNFN